MEKDAQREDHLKTQEEDGHLQAKVSGSRRNQCCQHLYLRLLASKIVKQLISIISATQSGTLLWQPEQTNISGNH